MKKILFSIIVPVYNTEKYIDECLSSILKQTYKNFEVLIIDDGSTDDSVNIINNYTKKDSRIKLFCQKNSGVSSARNYCIDHCKGDYILFVDSDDYIESNLLEKSLDFLSPDTLLVFGYVKRYINKDIVCCENKFELNDINIINEKIFNDYNVGGYMCNKIFSSKIIKENKLYLDKNLHYAEDQNFCLSYIKYCKKMIFIDYFPYIYRMRKTSASTTINTKSSSILDYLSSMIDLYYYNEKIVNKLKYNYLVNYQIYKKVYPNSARSDILLNEKKILNSNYVRIYDKLKYNIIYKHIFVYKLCYILKGLKYKKYD